MMSMGARIRSGAKLLIVTILIGTALVVLAAIFYKIHQKSYVINNLTSFNSSFRVESTIYFESNYSCSYADFVIDREIFSAFYKKTRQNEIVDINEYLWLRASSIHKIIEDYRAMGLDQQTYYLESNIVFAKNCIIGNQYLRDTFFDLISNNEIIVAQSKNGHETILVLPNINRLIYLARGR